MIPEGWKQRPQSIFEKQQNIQHYESEDGLRVAYSPMTGWVVQYPNGATKKTVGHGSYIGPDRETKIKADAFRIAREQE